MRPSLALRRVAAARPRPSARCASYRGGFAALALLLAGCVWKMATPAPRLAAGPRLSGITKGPYLQNATTTGITVCWVSENETTGKVTCQKSEGAPAGESSTAADTTPARYHRVQVVGLSPYTRYDYTVTCDGQQAEGTFLTAALPSQPFKFVAYGDNRTQPQKHAAVLARMMPFRPDFVIQTGDQVADGENEKQWDEFFAVARKMMSETAYYPTLGNHERHGAPYFRYFDLPRDYSFDYGNAHFVALDSTRPKAEQVAQDEWLRRDLVAHQNAVWRIVFLHYTPYTCVSFEERRASAGGLRKRLEPICKAGKVQVVFSGHDHNYQRHLAGGIQYIVTGGGGAPLYSVREDTPFLQKARVAHHHCEVTVNGPVLSVRVVEINGAVIEQFTVPASGEAEEKDRP